MPAVGAPQATPVGIGVLGGADIARRRFLPALAKSRQARLVAIASRDTERATQLTRDYGGVPCDYAALLADPQVHLVYIPLPNHLHGEWVTAALEQGKHVLCEKPLATDAATVERLLALAESRQLLLFENLMYLHHPQHRQVKMLLDAGRIGTLNGLHCRFTIPGPPPGDFRRDPAQGGGAFQDLNRYPLSAAGHFLHGRIERIRACQVEWHGDLDTGFRGTARSSAGEQFTCDIGFDRPYSCCYTITGSRGTLHLERAFTPPPDHVPVLQLEDGRRQQRLTLPAADQFQLTIDHVAGLLATPQAWPAIQRRSRDLARLAERFWQCATQRKGTP